MSTKNLYRIIVLAIFLVMPSSYSHAADFIQIDSPDYDDSFISTQNINVLFCSDRYISEPVVKCTTDNMNYHLDMQDFQGCKLAVFNPSSLDCTDMVISAKNGNEVVTKELEIKKFIDPKESILDAQRADGAFGDPIETAAATYFLSSYGTLYEDEIEDALDWLKGNRDNTYKCFPKGSCEIYETASVLYYLQAAGITDDDKADYEGRLWLEAQMNYIEDSSWKIVASTRKDEATCDVIAGDKTYSFEIGDDYGAEEVAVDYPVEYGDTYNVSCNGSATIDINDHDNRTIFRLTESTDDDYSMPKGACFSTDKWKGCNNHLTIMGISINLNEDMVSAAKEYLAEEGITSNDYGGEYVISIYPLRDSAIFYREIDQRLSVIKYLVFNQNNDGSYGDGSLRNQLIDTIFIAEALDSSGLTFTDGAVRDAKFWISNQMSSKGIDDVVVDSLTRKVFVNDYFPYVYYDKKIMDLDVQSNTAIEFSNPTVFNITDIRVELDTDLQEIMSYNLSNTTINTLGHATLNITRNKVNSGLYQGYMTLYGTSEGEEGVIARVPATSDIEPEIEMSVPTDITIVGSMGELPVTIDKVNSRFNCTLSFDSAVYSDTDFSVGLNDTEMDLYFDLAVPDREFATHDYLISCKSRGTVINKEGDITIDRYPSDIYSVESDKVTITDRGDTYLIPVKNNLFEDIEVTAYLKEDAGLLILEENSIVVPSNGTADLVLTTLIGKAESFEFDDVLVLESFGIEKEIKVDVDVSYVPFWNRLWVKVTKWTFFLIVLLGIAYAIYYYSLDIAKKSRSIEKKTENVFKKAFMGALQMLPETIKEKLHIKRPESELVGTLSGEEKEDDVKDYGGIDDIIKIMLSMDKQESEIKKRLHKEGLSDDEIEGAIAQVHKQMEEEDELTREKSIVDVIKKMDEDSDVVKMSLKSAGFSEKDINVAFEEIESELGEKQKALEEHLKKFKRDDEDEESEEDMPDKE